MIARFSFADEQVSRAMLLVVQPGHVVLDVGAHFGFFTLLGSWLVGGQGRVVAVEAIPSTFDQLQANVAANVPLGNAVAVHSAGGDSPGITTFFDYGLEYSSLNSAFGARGSVGDSLDEAPTEVRVNVRRVDDIVRDQGLDRVDYVKLDTESSEHLVLAGMSEVLSRFRPLISIELCDIGPAERRHSGRIIEIMEGHGYEPYRVARKGLTIFNPSTPFGYGNPLFAPKGDPRIVPLMAR